MGGGFGCFKISEPDTVRLELPMPDVEGLLTFNTPFDPISAESVALYAIINT